MPKFLLLETATEVCSVGISENNQLLALAESKEQYTHVSKITILIEECLKQTGLELSELDAIAVSRGPGSYTALRVGTATAKGICYALEKPLLAIDTLESLARASNESSEEKVLYAPMIDARRQEVYTAFFDSNFNVLQEAHPLILTETTFAEYLEEGFQIITSGNGAEKCQSIVKNTAIQYEKIVCSAAHLVKLAKERYANKAFEDLAYYAPFYLKPPNITTPKKNL